MLRYMNALPKIALFDDDEANIQLYKRQLKDHFQVIGLQNPHAFADVIKDDLSAVIIDVLMPTMDGLELYRRMIEHKQYNGCPIIFISASESEDVMRNALGIGAHDFLTRQMKSSELISRITNKISFHQTHKTIYQLGNVRINLTEFKVYSSDRPVDVTLTELKIMKYLISRYPNLSTRDEINNDVWPGLKVMPTTLNTHLSNLRNKFMDWEYEINIIKTKGVELVFKK